MKDITEKFGWFVITSRIDNPEDPGNKLVKIFTFMISLKIEHVKKKACQYWGPVDGNDLPDVLRISNIDPDAQVNDLPLLFVLVPIGLISKGIQVSKASFQYSILFVAWAKGLIRYLCIFHYRVISLNLYFWNPEINRKGKIHVFRPMRGICFSCYHVMVNSRVVMLRRTRSLFSHLRQLKVPFCSFVGAPLVFPFLIVCFIPSIRLLSLACFFVSSGINIEHWAPEV